MGTQPDQQAYSGIERSKRIAVRQPGASDFGSAANLRAGPRFEFLIGAYRYAWQPPETSVKLLGLHKPAAFPGSYGCVRGRAGDRRSDGVISNVAASAAHRAYRWTAILRDYGWLWHRYGLYPYQSYGPILLIGRTHVCTPITNAQLV